MEMDLKKKKSLLLKLFLGMIMCFVAMVLWQIFILKLLEKGTINTLIATIAIVGVLLFVLGGVAFVVRYIVGKFLQIFSGLKGAGDDVLDEKTQKLAERNDEIGEMARYAQDAFASFAGIVFPEFAIQVHRLEVYADLGKGEQHKFVALEDLGEDF